MGIHPDTSTRRGWGSSVLDVRQTVSDHRSPVQMITHGEDLEIHTLRTQRWSISVDDASTRGPSGGVGLCWFNHR